MRCATICSNLTTWIRWSKDEDLDKADADREYCKYKSMRSYLKNETLKPDEIEFDDKKINVYN